MNGSLAAAGFAAMLLTGACASTSNDTMTSSSTVDQSVQATANTAEDTDNTPVNDIAHGIVAPGAPMETTTTVVTVQAPIKSSSSLDRELTADASTNMTSGSAIDEETNTTATRTRMRKD
ncbi:MAG TPA: hypothetical protein VE010_17345 [Thermoanaerobaculia bacterium]|nr:hypothetical protein [Thermoanaerobaculia bacterium]